MVEEEVLVGVAGKKKGWQEEEIDEKIFFHKFWIKLKAYYWHRWHLKMNNVTRTVIFMLFGEFDSKTR